MSMIMMRPPGGRPPKAVKANTRTTLQELGWVYVGPIQETATPPAPATKPQPITPPIKAKNDERKHPKRHPDAVATPSAS